MFFVRANNNELLACALNAACLAIIDAGIPLRCPLAAVSCGTASIDGEEQLKLDPTAAELKVV